MTTAAKTVTIVCIPRRIGGSKIELYGKHYHFKPTNPADPEAPHVAEIPFDDARQIHRLLSIKGGYVLLDPNAEIPPRPAPEKGQTIAGTAAAAGVKPIIIKCGDVEHNLAEMDKEALVMLAKEEFQIKVHHKWDNQTIIAKIVEATRADEDDGE